MPNSVNTEIRSFIVETFLLGDHSQLPDDDVSLTDRDIVDSAGILELVSFLEEHFDIPVADPEIVPENFDTIARLAAFITGKLAQQGCSRGKAPAASGRTGGNHAAKKASWVP
ncbi:acyl carrier protein [Nitratireductor sp. ZSWI3]|uniref:acyl carrier protein n=1 Tax=Nitratireductor sp. ZSWI3 TaxID=2966359 RepID=UPI0027E31CC1|nr:acyl carrier protein [Nitratireductor sp. ZSWI3]